MLAESSFLKLKQTTSTEIMTALLPQIALTHSAPFSDTFKPILEKMMKARNSIDYHALYEQIQVSAGVDNCADRPILTYLRYVYLLDNVLGNDFFDSTPNHSGFSWTDSFSSQKTKALKSIKFELLNVLYNLAVTYYNEAKSMMLVIQDDERARAIMKLRHALWCLSEIKIELPILKEYQKDPFNDLNIPFIHFLQSLFQAETTIAYIQEISTQDAQYSDAYLASIKDLAQKSLKNCQKLLLEMKFVPFDKGIFQELSKNMKIHQIIYHTESLMHFAEVQIGLAEFDTSKPRIKAAISLLEMANMQLKIYLDQENIITMMPKEREVYFKKLSEKISQKLKEVVKLDNTKLELTNDLLVIPQLEHPISPVLPQGLLEMIDGEVKISGLLPKQCVDMTKTINYLFQCEVEDAKKLDAMMVEMCEREYSTYFTKFLVYNATNSLAIGNIPGTLRKKIENFNSRGGLSTVKKLMRETLEIPSDFFKDCLYRTNGLLKAEAEEYEAIKKQHPNRFRQEPSQNSNYIFYNSLKEIEKRGVPPEGRFNAEALFQDCLPWMETFSKGEDEWVGLIRNSFDKSFFKDGDQKRFGELIRIDKELSNLMFDSGIKLQLKMVQEKFSNTSFRLCCIRSLTNPTSKEPDHYKILEPFKKDLDSIKEQINKAYELLDKMVNEVKKLTAKTNPAAILEDMSRAMDDIEQLELKLNEMVAHGDILDKDAQNLIKIVTNYYSNRTEERKQFLKSIGDKDSEKYLTGPQFYHQKSQEFQKGNSVFLGAPKPKSLSGTVIIDDRNVV